MRKIRVCKNHPMKPANKECFNCKEGLCKLCGYYNGSNYYCNDRDCERAGGSSSKVIRF